MKYLAPLAVWAFLVATTVGEVLIFYTGPGTFTVDVSIGLVAMFNAVVTALFLMNIRGEPASVQYMILTPLVLVMVLILTLLFALAQ